MDDMDWRLRGLCRDDDPERWFPLSYKGKAAQLQVDEAKAVCRRCLVASECLAYAVDNGLPDGIFGGHTPAERPKPKPRKRTRRPVSDVDEVAVARAVAGKPVGRPLTTPERLRVVERMVAAGSPYSAAAAVAGVAWSTVRGLVAS